MSPFRVNEICACTASITRSVHADRIRIIREVYDGGGWRWVRVCAGCETGRVTTVPTRIMRECLLYILYYTRTRFTLKSLTHTHTHAHDDVCGIHEYIICVCVQYYYIPIARAVCHCRRSEIYRNINFVFVFVYFVVSYCIVFPYIYIIPRDVLYLCRI